MRAALLLAGALLAGLPASLIPPGLSAKRAAADSGRGAAPAQVGGLATNRTPPPALPTRVTITPSPAKLGQRMLYRGSILVPQGYRVRFDRPAAGGDFTWGDPHTGRTSVNSTRLRSHEVSGSDSCWIEVPLQVFTTGVSSVPGLLVEVTPHPTEGPKVVRRLPTGRVLVLPTITAADTNATLRALHGPFGAPWWERVPWPLVVAGLLLLAAVLAAIATARRRRRRVTAPAPVAAVPRPARDPAAEALAELAKLRALRLPEAGRFGDHALALTRILRRYLEAVVGTPRPGDTSGELVVRLRESRLEPADVERLEGLLGLWDRVKFARAPLGVEEAHRCETAVEALVRRREAREVA